MTISILLADNHRVVRQGLRSLLETQPDMEIIGEAENVGEAEKLVEELSPEITILDIGMADMNSIEAVRRISSELNTSKVIAFSMYRQKRFISEMFKAGAKAYLVKTCDFKEVVNAIHAVVEGRIYLSPPVAHTVVEEYVNNIADKSEGAFSLLSSREREVLQLVAEGKGTKEIAAMLHVSVKTIGAHRQNIMDKLGIHTIAGLTKYAIREGLTSLDA